MSSHHQHRRSLRTKERSDEQNATFTNKKKSTSLELSASGKALLKQLRGVVHVPYSWSRCLSEGTENESPLVFYCSPSGRVLRNLAEVKRYLDESESCNCYLLQKTLHLKDCFNFDPYVAGIQLPPPYKHVITCCQKYIKQMSRKNSENAIVQRRTSLEKLFSYQTTVDRELISELSIQQMKLRLKKDKLHTAGNNDNINVSDDKTEDKESDDDATDDEEEEIENEETTEETVVRMMLLFDWSKVNVLTDGRVYLRQINDNQWHHRLSEWKDTDDFSLQKSVTEFETTRIEQVVAAETANHSQVAVKGKRTATVSSVVSSELSNEGAVSSPRAQSSPKSAVRKRLFEESTKATPLTNKKKRRRRKKIVLKV